MISGNLQVFREMSAESELNEARREIERLEAELARTTKVQEDLWAHKIYIEARRKMTVGVFAVIGLLSGLGLFTAYDIYNELLQRTRAIAEKTILSRIDSEVDQMLIKAAPKLEKQLSGESETLIKDAIITVRERIGSKVDQMVKDAAPKLQEQLSDKTDTLIEDTITTVQERIGRLNEQVAAVEVVAKRADDAAERLKEITLAMTAPEDAQQEDTGRAGVATGCNPLQLTESESALISIKQDTQATNTFARTQNRLRFFKNTFSVAARGEAARVISPSLLACVLDAIDRVVYNLNKRWFSPSKVVSIDKDNGFRLSRRVYGPVDVTVAVYLKGKQDPIKYFGSLMHRELGEQYLKKGVPNPSMLGNRPY